MNKSFSLHIEFMRIIACFFVIFTHTRSQGYFLFSLYTPDNISYWICLFFSIFCKFAVPLFLCISGALLLNNIKNENTFFVIKHRLLRFSIVLTLFSFLYYLVEVFINHPQNFDFINFLQILISKNWNFSYWYLYLLIAFLLTLPILCKLIKNLSIDNYYYIFSLYIVFVPILSLISFFNEGIGINKFLIPTFFTSMIIIYPLLGYFLEHVLKTKIKKSFIIKLWCINIVCIIIASILTYYRIVLTGECIQSKSQYFHNTFVIINCFSIYITSKYIFEKNKINNIVKNILLLLGRCSFGIYLFHVLILNMLNKTKFLSFLKEDLCIYPLLAIFIYCFVILIISFMITYLLKKIRLINKFI